MARLFTVISLVVFFTVSVQCLTLVLYIVGMSAWSKDEDTVSDTYWTFSESANSNELITMYGLRSIVSGNTNNDDTSGHTTYDDCDDLDYCVNCRSAGKTALAMCLISFFTVMPLVITTGLRIMKKMDNKIVKLSSIVLTSTVLFWTIVGVWNWNGTCVAYLPIQYGTTGYKHGPGYNCVACNIFWMLLSLYIHVSTTADVSSDGSTSERLTEQEESADTEGQFLEGGGSYVPATDSSEKQNQV